MTDDFLKLYEEFLKTFLRTQSYIKMQLKI